MAISGRRVKNQEDEHETRLCCLLQSFKMSVLLIFRSFPNNYWDKFVKRKVGVLF